MKRFIYFTFAVLAATISFGQAANNDSLAIRHQRKMDIIMKQPKVPIKTIGVLLYDGYQTLDAMGPYETLGNLPSAKVFFIGKEKGSIKNQRGMKVKVDTSINEVSKLDILVIPGGAAETYLMSKDTTILNWIKQIDKTTFYTTSVCTGSWILGATGLLNGKNATTNWYRAEEMLNKYGATFIDARWVQDGKYWTSAGVTAGIDMSLAIINDLMGPQFTQATMLNLEYNPGPPVTGGSPKNTDPVVTEMMLEMYDMGLKPLMDKDKKKKTPVFEQWPALDEYHKIMSKTFHPAEEGNLEPTKTNAAELAVKAKLLSQSDIPESFTKQGMTGIVEKLEKESAALAKMVNDKKSDAELTKAIFALHDRFHEIMGKCRE